jgi:hypothetical protein
MRRRSLVLMWCVGLWLIEQNRMNCGFNEVGLLVWINSGLWLFS